MRNNMFAEMRFGTVIHLRYVGAGEIMKRTVWMTVKSCFKTDKNAF